MCYSSPCANYSLTKCFKNCKKNISTDGEVMAKIKVACFFFWDTVYIAYIQRYTAAQQYIVASLIGSVVYVSR